MHKLWKSEKNMDLVTKRKMIDVLRGIIGSGFNGTQDDLKNALEQKGFSVTQSTISRALKKMGIVKVGLPEGGSRYELKPQRQINSYGGNVKDLVVSILHNESMVIVKTNPGSAMFTAGFLDHGLRDEILGTIAGDDTIFIAPVCCKKIKECAKRVEMYVFQN